MSPFRYQNGALHCEDVSLAAVADAVGTPVYVYSSAALEAQYRAFAEAFAGQNARVCFAVKANSNQAVIRTFAALGAGADVLSEGELRRALAAGVPASKVVFSGVGKSREEMAFALDAGVGQMNVESLPELRQLSEVATRLNKTAAIAVRVNPDVDAKTHAKITTGKKENKFGIDYDVAPAVYAEAAKLPGIQALGIAVHIGSQLLDLAPFRDAFALIADLAQRLRADGHDIRRLDLGGGLGIPYRDETPPPPAAYAAVVKETVGQLGCELTFEPGRLLVGNAGVLISRVLYVKDGSDRRFVIVDAAMNDLMRPALYEAWHDIRPLAEPAKGAAIAPVDVVGPVCETTDIFAKDRSLPPLGADDLVAFGSAGAYGAVMASDYNSRPLVPEVLVKGGDYAVIRPRQTYDEMLGRDRLPAWLQK
ncbi:MAG TPA: diaminopimelate decarboxylase [Alphaproteobacteria bacterium]|jgi:diaminopimelate decarboxylase